MGRVEKDQEIQFLTDCITKAQGVLCINYHGLDVNTISVLRKKLRVGKSGGRVVKNTLVKRALKAAGKSENANPELEKFIATFEGPSFLIYSLEDHVSPAKVVDEFSRQHQKCEVKGGFVDGAYLDPKAVEALSKLPSKEDTLSALLRVMNAPATDFVRLLSAPATQLVRVIEAYRQKLEGTGI